MFPCVKELTHFDGALKIHKILLVSIDIDLKSLKV